MVLDQATHAAHEAYISHAMRCRSCNPPTNRYCIEGERLLVNYDANYLLSQDLYTRRIFLDRLEVTHMARCIALKGRILKIHAKNRPSES